MNKKKDIIVKYAVTICGLFVIFITLAIGAFLLYKGSGTFSKYGLAVPFSLSAAIFITEISPKYENRIILPAAEIFVGIPLVVYGWIGLSLLVSFIQKLFKLPMGFSVQAAGIVLVCGIAKLHKL